MIRCLIIDDSPWFAREARELLEEEGICVLGVATNGDEAQRLARDLRPDLALVDIELGPENGFDIARHLCSDEDTSVAVILVSTHAEADFAELIAKSPAVGFLAKSELSAGAIEALLRRPDRTAGPVI
jgi:DNA-binding NarL/FixJ family response regulator